jgi:ribosomal protein S18 acetylase RimI-like enzyme
VRRRVERRRFAARGNVHDQGRAEGHFDLGRLSQEDIKKLIDDAFLFLVLEENSQIKGYCIAVKEKEFHDTENKVWFDLRAKKLYYEDKGALTIEAIAVSPQFLHQGVGSALLSEVEKEMIINKMHYLFSIISISPIENKASVLFHEKHHFLKIAESKKKTLFEIENYSAALYFKEL